MKKTRIAGLLLAGACVFTAAGLSACAFDAPEDPTVQPGESTVLVTNKAPQDLSPENVIYAFLQKQSELQSYVITTEGSAVASLAGYEQDIHNVTYKNGSDYLSQASSDSVLVKMKHQSFSKGGKVVYRNSFDGEMKVAEKSDYVKIYGFTADDVTLGGYVVNAKTLRYAELRKEEGDTLTYYYRLAGDQSLDSGAATESATAGMRLQAKAYGSLDNLPAYSDVDVTLTVKKDWTPVSYTSACSYEARKVFDMSVTQSVTCTYSLVNETVAIPDVEKFNEKIGSTPSEIEQPTETDPAMQMLSAFGNSLDEANTLTLPVSVKLGVADAYKTAAGDLKVSVKQAGLESGDYLNAFTLELGLDLSEIPLVSGLANALSLRYVGDGVLLLTLENKTETATSKLLSYPIDLKDTLSGAPALAPDTLQETLGGLLSLEKTETGYTLTLTDEALTQLNTAFSGLLESLKATLGNFLPSLLDLSFDGLTLELATATAEGKETITGLTAVLDSTPAERAGEAIGFDIEIGLPLSQMLIGSFAGDLELRLNPAALWADPYAIALGHLHLDLTPALGILQMVGGFAAGSLPPFVGPALNSLDVYYAGDGVLTLALNNAEQDPLFVTQVDLKTVQMPALPANGAAMLLSEFRFEKQANGVLFALGAPIVEAVNAAYGQLVQTAANYVAQSAGDLMAPIAGMLVQNMIGAQITNLEFFLGTNDDGKVMFDFAIKGIPTYDAEEDYSERRLLALTFTDRDPLTPGQQTALSACKETANALLAQNAQDNATADAFAKKLQPYIENVALTEEYVQKVDALKEEFDAFPANVQTIVSNASFMADATYNSETYSKLYVIYKLYLARAKAFKALLPANDDYTGFESWDAINGLYDKADTSHQYDLGVDIPAVKDSAGMKTYIGEARVTAYETARDTHENPLAQELNDKIAASKAKYENATTHDELTAALTEIVKDFKPAYDKLTAKNQKLVTNYQDYVATIYEKNIDEATAEYETVKGELEKLIEQGKEAKIEDLLQTMKKLSSAYAWYSGNDYWTSNALSHTMMAWGNTWVTSLKPTWLAETEQTALDQKVTALTELNNELIKGETEKTVATALKDVIKQAGQALYTKIGACMVKDEAGAVTWNFSKFDSESDKNNAALLEQLHGFRFMFLRVLPPTEGNAIWDSDAVLKNFASLFASYESNFANYLAKKAEPQA